MLRRVMEMLREEKLEEVGKVAHYFTKIEVAVIDLTAPLSVGDRITIKGATTDFEQTVDSMQIEHENVKAAKAGDSIGVKVKERVRESDVVYKIV
jgi:translation elongation factor EF-1alpha